MYPSDDDKVTSILKERCGVWSIVELRDGKRFRVFDIAWGRDMGDEHDHITTNISPGPPEGAPFDFFFTSNVVRIIDETTETVLFQRDIKAA